jgi:mannose-6-phosphate isomerase-like protein (cupin superfamily)
MRSAKLDEMKKGWFVGGFNPTAHSTEACEVAVKYYKAADKEGPHLHRVATEITLVLSGRAQMVGKEWRAGEILVLEPGEITDFEALTDCITVVVKLPSVLNDKYPVGQ